MKEEQCFLHEFMIYLDGFCFEDGSHTFRKEREGMWSNKTEADFILFKNKTKKQKQKLIINCIVICITYRYRYIDISGSKPAIL